MEAALFAAVVLGSLRLSAARQRASSRRTGWTTSFSSTGVTGDGVRSRGRGIQIARSKAGVPLDRRSRAATSIRMSTTPDASKDLAWRTWPMRWATTTGASRRPTWKVEQMLIDLPHKKIKSSIRRPDAARKYRAYRRPTTTGSRCTIAAVKMDAGRRIHGELSPPNSGSPLASSHDPRDSPAIRWRGRDGVTGLRSSSLTSTNLFV